jgi:hypothetical protein
MVCLDGNLWYMAKRCLKAFLPTDGSHAVVVEPWKLPGLRARWCSIRGGLRCGSCSALRCVVPAAAEGVAGTWRGAGASRACLWVCSMPCCPARL